MEMIIDTANITVENVQTYEGEKKLFEKMSEKILVVLVAYF